MSAAATTKIEATATVQVPVPVYAVVSIDKSRVGNPFIVVTATSKSIETSIKAIERVRDSLTERIAELRDEA
jgi:aminoglycoside phosphotransferase (APT) family kinase protein